MPRMARVPVDLKNSVLLHTVEQNKVVHVRKVRAPKAYMVQKVTSAKNLHAPKCGMRQKVFCAKTKCAKKYFAPKPNAPNNMRQNVCAKKACAKKLLAPKCV